MDVRGGALPAERVDPAGEPPVPPVEEEAPAPSLGRRLRSPRTIASVVLVLGVVVFAVWRANIDWSGTWDNVRHASPGLYALALLAYYCSFVVRGVRWRILLENVGDRRPAAALTLIVIASFFVNCVVPAKMGDVYRAYLVRRREEVAATRALGTIIAERLVDLVVLMALLVLAIVGVARNHLPAHQFIPALALGVALCVVGIGVFTLMAKGRGRRILARLPQQAVERYEHFRQGTVHALTNLRVVVPLTVLVWALEAGRLGLVVESLPAARGHLGPATFLLVALIAALLTTVPFTPGGLGLVEGGMTLALTQIGNLPGSVALSAALLDRSVSYLSLLVVGFIVFLLMQRAPRPRLVADGQRT